MIDNVFGILMEQKLVDWEVIRQGLTDVPGLPDVLSSGSVAIFSTARLELVEPTSPFLTQIVAMATEPHLSTRELLTMVDQICAKTAINQLHGRRCWRFGILAELLWVATTKSLHIQTGIRKSETSSFLSQIPRDTGPYMATPGS